MKTALLLIVAALPLAACATTSQSRAEKLAYCQAMQSEMGTDTLHDHAASKGMAPNSMNLNHDQCRQLLQAR